MSKAYKALVNEDISVALDASDAVNTKLSGKNIYSGLLDNKQVKAGLIASDFDSKTYTFKINANTYTVQLQTALDQLIEDLGLSLGSDDTASSVEAPMPGLIIDILVKAGDSVEEGDNLLILEAMKMENMLVAPRTGIIKAVHVSKQETVDKGMVLIEFEEDEEN